MKTCTHPLALFWFFFRIGWFTFGGGWSILSQMEREYIEKHKAITQEELLDITSVGRSLPGIMITNISWLFGYRLGGIPCALAAMLGMILPSILILSGIGLCYTALRDNPFVMRVLAGIRCAVVPIIGHAGWSLSKAALKDKLCYTAFAIALLLCLFTNLGNIPVVLLGVLAGFLRWGVLRHGTF